MRFTRTPGLRKYSVALLGAFIGGCAYAQPETPMIKEVNVQIVCSLTGPNSKVFTLELREAENPWGPWSVPIALATAQKFPALYGAFMTPSFLRDSGKSLCFVMSMFGPYEAFLMKAKLETYQ